MPRKVARSASASERFARERDAAIKRAADRIRADYAPLIEDPETYTLQVSDDLSEADLIPGVGTVVLGRPETADALAQLHQYDDSADGIGVLEPVTIDPVG